MFHVTSIRYRRDDGRERVATFPRHVSEDKARGWMRRNLSKTERETADMVGSYGDYEPTHSRNKYPRVR